MLQVRDDLAQRRGEVDATVTLPAGGQPDGAPDEGIGGAQAHPEKLIEKDTSGWFRLADVLQNATQRLWRGGNDPADRLFETVLLVPGFDA